MSVTCGPAGSQVTAVFTLIPSDVRGSSAGPGPALASPTP
jgi:hypothetical protein